MLENRRLRFGLALAAAALVSGALIAVGQIATRDEAKTEAPATTAVPARGDRAFAGIPQQGSALGQPTAPLTLVEYADLQCPYCAQWARQTLPVLVADYVRKGGLRIEFRGLAFLGPESVLAVKTAIAAGRYGRLWDVVDTLYRNQGAENSGWVNEEFLADVAAQVGLDYDRLAADRELAFVGRELARSQNRAAAAGVNGVPAFALGPTGGPMTMIRLSSLLPEGIIPAIEAARST